MTIVGLDIGLSNFGAAVLYTSTGKIVALDAVLTSSGTRRRSKFKIRGKKRSVRDCDKTIYEDLASRIVIISRWLLAVLDLHQPTRIVAEAPHAGAQSGAAMRAMAMSAGAATAVLTRWCDDHKATYHLLSPTLCQMLVCGQRTKDKAFVRSRVITLAPEVEMLLQQSTFRVPAAEAAVDAAQCVLAEVIRNARGPNDS